MLMKAVILLFLIMILYSLGSGLYYLVNEKSRADSDRVVKALTWRIFLSLFLFLLLFAAYLLGWIHPHGI
jgi:hypothetical protein